MIWKFHLDKQVEDQAKKSIAITNKLLINNFILSKSLCQQQKTLKCWKSCGAPI